MIFQKTSYFFHTNVADIKISITFAPLFEKEFY